MFVTGNVYTSTSSTPSYQVGSGEAGVAITLTGSKPGQVWHATANDAGNYAVEVPAGVGQVTVTAASARRLPVSERRW